MNLMQGERLRPYMPYGDPVHRATRRLLDRSTLGYAFIGRFCQLLCCCTDQHHGLKARPTRRNHGNTYEIWPRKTAAEGNQAAMTLPINWDTPPAVCNPPYSSCVARPLYPHVRLLPTGEYFLCAIKCAQKPSRPLWPPVPIALCSGSASGAGNSQVRKPPFTKLTLRAPLCAVPEAAAWQQH